VPRKSLPRREIPLSEVAFSLPFGRITCRVTAEALPLSNLLGIASAAEPPRPYAFITKVAGRHWPTRPLVMRHLFMRLCASLLAHPAHQGLPGPVWTIGLDEAGALLAGGVANTLAQTQHREDLYFQHTTGLQLGDKPLLDLGAPGPAHYLRHPLSLFEEPFFRARTLVLADEELTPEHPLLHLAERLGALSLTAERIVILSLANWLDHTARQAVAQRVQAAWGRRKRRPPLLTWCSLLEGTVDFQPPAVSTAPTPAGPPPGRPRPVLFASDHQGRRGLHLPLAPPLNTLRLVAGLTGPTAGELPALALIGTGEYVLQPYLAALRLADKGFAVNFHCSSRAKLLTGGDIAAVRAMPDPYLRGQPYYLYNPPDPRVYQTVALYETPEAASQPHDGMTATTLRDDHGRWG